MRRWLLIILDGRFSVASITNVSKYRYLHIFITITSKLDGDMIIKFVKNNVCDRVWKNNHTLQDKISFASYFG